MNSSHSFGCAAFLFAVNVFLTGCCTTASSTVSSHPSFPPADSHPSPTPAEEYTNDCAQPRTNLQCAYIHALIKHEYDRSKPELLRPNPTYDRCSAVWSQDLTYDNLREKADCQEVFVEMKGRYWVYMRDMKEMGAGSD